MRQNKKDQVISDVVSSFGFAFELLKVIAHAVMAKGGNMQHLRRIVKEPTLQWQIADLVVSVGSAGERPHDEKEYLVPVDYTALPSFTELEKEFGKGNVSNLFDGRSFQKHASCANLEESHSDKIFLVKHFNREVELEDAIAEMDKLGYRPATHIEGYAFQKANPELQRQFWIVAPGSFAPLGGGPCVAVLHGLGSMRVAGCSWFDNKWRSDFRFLFVRKETLGSRALSP
ncbi:MAG: hypothetical protein WC787_05365 [Patescibacteria group bacterium]|jgi:hypothetical protein